MVFLLTGSRVVKRFVVNDHVLKMIPLLDGSRTVEQLCDLVGPGSREAADEVTGALDVMRRERLLSVVDGPADAVPPDDADLERHDRQIRLFQDLCDEGLSADSRGIELQRRLRRATAVVCGLGGVGSWLVQGLAAAGVGTLRVCDFDRVERSNLGRQILYSTSDIGRLKTEAAAERVAVIDPQVRVEPVTRRITSPGDLSDLIAGADVVVGCGDQPSPYVLAGWIAAACMSSTARPAPVPHIVGGSYAYHVGILGTTVIPGTTACWQCVRAETANDHGREGLETIVARRAVGAASAPMSGLVGLALTWEAMRVLAGLPPALANSWSELDFWNLRVDTRAIPRRPDCPVCGG
ncbi:HesA/MoeB/ThiF family protein [Virgisporangium aurantiacum]|uniref:HesA/MoeB/ThiF family protein n=1 Tax=Virgisporangium aurantiacum TaxID=175570 RepID=UPI001951B0EA|nr:ThiF family adenylyltransferase [Virgisporangium aurantiacum]